MTDYQWIYLLVLAHTYVLCTPNGHRNNFLYEMRKQIYDTLWLGLIYYARKIGALTGQWFHT